MKASRPRQAHAVSLLCYSSLLICFSNKCDKLDDVVQLDRGGVQNSKDLRYALLSNLEIDSVNASEFESFTGLHTLDLSGNYLPMVQFKKKVLHRSLLG